MQCQAEHPPSRHEKGKNYKLIWLVYGLPYFLAYEYSKRISYERMRRKAWGLFGFAVSITHNFVFITHNSKMVGPITEKFVWILFLVFVFITQFSNFWVMSNGNWKHILGLFSFHNSIFNSIFVINYYLAAMLDFFGYLFIYYYFFETEPSHNVGIFFFFLNFFGNKVMQN